MHLLRLFHAEYVPFLLRFSAQSRLFLKQLPLGLLLFASTFVQRSCLIVLASLAFYSSFSNGPQDYVHNYGFLCVSLERNCLVHVWIARLSALALQFRLLLH